MSISQLTTATEADDRLLTPAEHYAAAEKALALADIYGTAGPGRMNDRRMKALHQSALVHAVLAGVDFQVYSDAKSYVEYAS